MITKLTVIKEKFDSLASDIVKPNVISDNKLYTKLIKEYNALQPISDVYDQYIRIQKTKNDAKELLKTETDNEMVALLEEEILECESKLNALDEEIKIMLLPKDENDEKNVIMEIRAGAGGEEASLFCTVLYRMYTMYAERMRWKIEVLDINETELGGLKEIAFMIQGKDVFKNLKYESGVHRVQRVPETESSGRIHTSTATVAVLPEHEEVDVEIHEKDLRIDTYRSSGAGGQHVNTTDSAIRITHLPTGIVVACQDGRSQIKNRDKAMKVLKSKLYDHWQMQLDTEYAKNRREQVGTGDRSERIRTYNYPQSRMTDHRINYTTHNLDELLNGEMGELIENLAMFFQKQKLEEM